MTTFLVFLVVPIAAFALSYHFYPKIQDYLHRRTLGSREEIIRKLDLMFVKIEPQKVTWALIFVAYGPAAIIFLAMWPNIGPGLILSFAFVLVGWTLPRLVVDSLYQKRCDVFVNQMVDGMTIMANGVKSGLSITQSMDRVVLNLSNPIRQEFRLVLSEIQLGRSVEESLTDLGERIPRPDVQMFVTSVNILKETGGNMAETFQTINFTIRERQKLEKKIEALTTQGVTQGIIVSLVPLGLVLIFSVIDPNYIRPLFTKPLGWFALFLTLVLQAMGGMMIRRIVKINV